MPKKMDGIEKLSEKELKKSRKIVLDYIGEEDKNTKKQKSDFIGKKLKTMDGIKLTGNKNKKRKTSKKVFNNKDFFDKLKNSQDNKKSISKNGKNIKSTFSAVESQKNISKKTSETGRKKTKKKSTKRKEETLKSKKKSTKRKAPAGKRKTLNKKTNNNKKNFFLSNLKFFKNNKLSGFIKKFTLKEFFSCLGFSFLFLSASLLFLYLVFSVLILRFDIKSGFIKKTLSYIPIPAVISKDGVIMYEEYDENKDFLSYSETIILNKLAKKYNIDYKKENIFNYKNIIEEEIIEDKEINRVAFIRIRDVENAIKSNMDFNAIKETLGDESGVLNTNDLSPFEEFVKNLEVGEVSDVVKTAEGNYFFKKTGNIYHYIKINNVNLEEYLKKQQEKMKLFFLVK